jgi:hypothetical protein
MSDNTVFKKIALILFGLVLLLLIANIVVKKISGKDEQPKNRESLSGIEIDKIFHTALNNYGLSKNWIIKKRIKNISDDSLYSTYIIKVPKNLPIPLLILELQDLFWDDDVNLKAEEFTPAKKTIIKLSSQNHLKVAAEFSYDENLNREHGYAAFMVYDFPFDDENKKDELLKTPEPFYVVLPPSTSSKSQIDRINKSEKRYAILLDDNIDELVFKLDGKYSEDRLKRSIREIVGTFSNAVFFIIDDRSDLFESEKFRFIENEFRKRNIKIVHKSKLSSLDANSLNVDGKFQDFMLTVKKNDEKVLLVTADEFLSIAQLIPLYRKIGYKFIYPGDIIIKR